MTETATIGRPPAEPVKRGWLSTAAAARQLGVGRGRINELVRRRRLKVRWYGNVKYVAEESVARYAAYRKDLVRLRQREGLSGVT